MKSRSVGDPRGRLRTSRQFFYIACLLLGGHSLLAQVLLVREFLVVFFGNELCLGIILSSWLIGIALGSQVAARLLRSEKRSDAGVATLALAMTLFLPAALIAARSVRLLLGTPAGQLIPFGKLWLGTLALVTPVSILSGANFPLLCAALARRARDAGWEIGKVYVLEAAGAVAAGALFTYVLVGRTPAFTTAFAAGLLLAVNAAAIAFAADLKRLKLPAVTLLLIAAAGLALSKTIERKSIALRWNSFAPGVELLHSADSRYENIAVGKLEDTFQLYANGQYVTSFPDPYYYEQVAHLVMVEHPSPKSVLLIGGGVEGLLKEILKHGVERLDVVLLDPKLLDLVRPYLAEDDARTLASPKVKVLHVDGRHFVKTTRERYDMVISYVPDPSTAMLNRLYTKEFFADAKRTLNESGVFVTSVTSAANYIGEEVGDYAGSVYETLKKSFAHVVAAPGDVNTFFCSDYPGVVTDDPQLMARRYEDRRIQPEKYKEMYELMLMPPERTKELPAKLAARAPGVTNSDFRPVTYFFNLILWGRFSGSKAVALLAHLKKLRASHLLAAIGLLLVLRLVYRAVRRRGRRSQWRTDILLAIGTTGMAAMGLEVILLLAFQSIYGYVYAKIGMVVAMFMAGLALGGLSGAKLAGSQAKGTARRPASLLVTTEGLIAGFAVALPFAIRGLSTFGARPEVEAAFMGLVAAAGFLTGLEFPIASSAYLATGAATGLSAGMVDSADHIGAAAGAALAGVILLPVLGIPGACMVLAAANAATGVLQMFHVEQSSSAV